MAMEKPAPGRNNQHEVSILLRIQSTQPYIPHSALLTSLFQGFPRGDNQVKSYPIKGMFLKKIRGIELPLNTTVAKRWATHLADKHRAKTNDDMDCLRHRQNKAHW